MRLCGFLGRNCLRISGVPDNTEGSTDDYVCSLAQSIDVNLKLEDIDRSHRIGKPVSTGDGRKPRDTIVKFVSYRKRAQFYKARVLTKSDSYHHALEMPFAGSCFSRLNFSFWEIANVTHSTYNTV